MSTTRRREDRRPAAARVHSDELRRWRVYLVCAVAVAVPVAFNTSADDTFGLVKFTLLVWAVLALAVTWVAAWVRDQRMPMLRNGMHWPVVALVAWTAVATVASVNPRMSLLGYRGSYDGLFLALAVAALFFVAVEAVTVVHLRLAVSALYFGAGGIVLFYGLIQMHDRLTTWGGTWDAVDWGEASFRSSSIWSTLGNPNHLGGFAAMLLPIGIALFLVHRSRLRRAVIAVMTVVALVEALYTTSRGAWLASLAGLVVLAVLLFGEIRRRPDVLAAAGAAVVVSVVAGALLLGPGDFGRQFGSIFDPQGRTTTERTELWKAAWNMAADKPVLGWGPDTYRIPFNEYQSRRYVEEFGARNVANGPHNVFFAYLAHLGFPGLLLFLGLLGAAALRAVGAWRRLAAFVVDRRPEVRRGAEDVRYLFAGLVAASVAFLVQASFNTQQIVLTVTFWVVLALLTSVTLDAGVPPALSPRAVLAVPDDERPRRLAPAEVRGLDGPRSRPDYGRTLAVAGGVGVVALAVAWLASAPFRADATFFDAETAGNRALTLAENNAVNEARAEGDRALRMMDDAIAANPWEARYAVEAGNLAVELGRFELSVSTTDPQTVRRAVALFQDGRRLLARAARVQAGHFPFLSARARALDRIRVNAPEGTIDVTAEVVAAYREAIRANPWDPELVTELARVLADTGRPDEARSVLEAAAARQPADVDLLVTLAQLEDQAGDRADARATWRKVLELTPDHSVARTALGQDGGE